MAEGVEKVGSLGVPRNKRINSRWFMNLCYQNAGGLGSLLRLRSSEIVFNMA